LYTGKTIVMTEKEFDALVDIKISQLLKAAADYHNRPEKAKEYITTTIKNISLAAKKQAFELNQLRKQINKNP